MYDKMDEIRAYFQELERNHKPGIDNSAKKIQFLLKHNFHCLTLPAAQHKRPLRAQDYAGVIRTLATLCPSTALSMAMHLYTVWGLGKLLDGERHRKYWDDVQQRGAIFGSLNEPGLYFVSPQQLRDSDYSVLAESVPTGYSITGVKKYVSMEPFVRYLPVYCKIKGYSGKYHGLMVAVIDKQAPGVTVIRDWRTVSMSFTHSNSVRFDQVHVASEDVVCGPERSVQDTELLGYLFRLSIASVYRGASERALVYIAGKSKRRRVPHSSKPLSFFPGVQATLAEMIVLAETSDALIDRYCRILDVFLKTNRPSSSLQKEIKMISLIAKDYVVKSAEQIVHKAMKIEGIESIRQSSPLSTLFKEVKAGLFHPPQSDITHELLAKDYLGIIPLRNRW